MIPKAKERQAIRRGSTVPAYYQLADILRQRIADLPQAERANPLPSEGELARQYCLSRITVRQALKSLEAKGLVEKVAGDLDGRRRAASLTPTGQAFEERIAERLRAQLARSYRVGGLDGVAGVRQILSALAGGRMKSGGA